MLYYKNWILALWEDHIIQWITIYVIERSNFKYHRFYTCMKIWMTNHNPSLHILDKSWKNLRYNESDKQLKNHEYTPQIHKQ